jgi:glycosyltransferase involved in cell wall biosynthesis
MRPFLQERFDTILGQTMRDWELFVYDSCSDDGAWECIQNLVGREDRMRAVQGPRKGPYPAWNECLRRTTAEFVYIATSDDTMALDCLEKLVEALEQHKECDLAHCPLVLIDEAGRSLSGSTWPDCTVFANGMPGIHTRPHIRLAPYDGLLYLSGQMVYYSITQLLVRRSLFSRIGDFPARWGSVGDVNWHMKAGLVANTIHVPDTWASYRVHARQATAAVLFHSVEHARRWEEMIRDAILACETDLEPAVWSGLKNLWLERTEELRTYYANLRFRRNIVRRRLFQAAQLASGTRTVRTEIMQRLLGRPKWPDIAPSEIRLWLESIGLEPVLNLKSESYTESKKRAAT